MKNNILIVLLCLIVSLPTISAATNSDTTPPVLKNIEFSKPLVKAGESVTAYVSAEDDLSGVRSPVVIKVKSPTGQSYIKVPLIDQDSQGRWYGELMVPADAKAGQWQLEYIYMYDKAENLLEVNNFDNYNFAKGFKVENPNSDTTPPVLTNVEFSKPLVKAGEIVTAYVSAEDDLSGIRSPVVIKVKSPTGQSYIKIPLIDQDSQGRWYGELMVPADAEAGQWQLEYIYMYDKAENLLEVNNFDNYSFAKGFMVENSNLDTIPPVRPIVNEVNDKDTQVTGLAEAGSIITVKAGDQMLFLGKAYAGNDGTFSLPISIQKAGTVLYVTATDQAGNNSEVTKIIVKSDEQKVVSLVIDVKSPLKLKPQSVQPIKLTAIYDDKTKEDVASKVEVDIDNPNVVSFELDDNGNGNLIAKQEGISNILFSYKGKIVKITVIVVKIIAVTGVTLDQTSLSLTEGGETGRLVATINPENATNKTIKWISSNPGVAAVDQNGVVTPVAAGTATVIVITEDGLMWDTCLVTVNSNRQKIVSLATNVKSTLKLKPGAVRKIKLMAVYDNKTKENVASKTEVYIDNPEVYIDHPEVVSFELDENGLGQLIAQEEGISNVTFSYDGKKVNVIVIVKDKTVKRLMANVKSILKLKPDAVMPMKLTAAYDDNSKEDVTAITEVEIDNPDVVSFELDENGFGQLFAQQKGTTNVTFSYRGKVIKIRTIVN